MVNTHALEMLTELGDKVRARLAEIEHDTR
jgi:hypothetical protein